MRMLSGRMHWLTVGLALLVSAQVFTTSSLWAQAPLKPSGKAGKRQAQAKEQGTRVANNGPGMYVPGGMPTGMMPPGMGPGMMPPGMGPGMMPPGMGPGMMPPGMGPSVMQAGGMSPAAGMSMAFPGPAPGEVVYAGASSCDGGCSGGCCGAGGCCGDPRCGSIFGSCCCGSNCGCGSGCGMCGGMGCGACGGGGAQCGCLFSGQMLNVLGPLAPFSEGGCSDQRWFDFYIGTIALSRTSNFGGFQTSVQDPQTGQFQRSNLISTNGTGTGTPVLYSNNLNLDQLRFGLELQANLQTGVGSNIEARYFGLNKWQETASVNTIASGNPTLFSVFSLYGTTPVNGFDDTDRSFIHTIDYDSEMHNGEVNFRRRWVPAGCCPVQGSWLVGIRYFDLDERFGFNAVGSNNNTFTFSQLRFFNFDTRTRNQLTGVQAGGDLWLSVVPGLRVGVEGKGGIFGNHAEVHAQAVSNSIPGATEFLQTGRTAYMGELVASLVYRASYSWSIRGSYNLLYIDKLALAAENMNTRDFSNGIGGGNFTAARAPFIDVDGTATYQGFSIGAEYLW